MISSVVAPGLDSFQLGNSNLADERRSVDTYIELQLDACK